MQNKDSLNKIYKVNEVLLHLSIFFSIMQLICPFYEKTNIRPDYICLIGVLITFIFVIRRSNIKLFFKSIIDVLLSYKFLTIMCCAYFVWDTINFLYSKDPIFVIDKYLIWGKISLLCICIIYYINPVGVNIKINYKINMLLANLGLTSIILSLIANVGYYTDTFTEYENVITTISDYNVFSSGIMFGFVCLCYLLIFCKNMGIHKRIVLIGINVIICLPVMYLSGSRRTIILLFIFVIWFIIYILFSILKEDKNIKKICKNIFLICIVVIISFLLCLAQIKLFDLYSSNKTDSPGVSEKVETIIEGSGLDLRLMIWKSSIQWYNEMEPVNKLIGGGGSYHSDVFNDLNASQNKDLVEHYNIKEGTIRWMRPHNFLLEDLLIGGIIKIMITLGIIVLISAKIIRGIIKGQTKYNILIVTLYAVLLGNLMMGGYWGLFGNRYTWIIITLHYLIMFYYKVENDKMERING